MSARLRFRSRKRSVSESLRRGNLIGVAVMKTMKIQIFALFTFFIFTNAAQAVDLDDMGVTIQMIESEDMKEVSKELSLPDVASEVAKQHMEEHENAMPKMMAARIIMKATGMSVTTRRLRSKTKSMITMTKPRRTSMTARMAVMIARIK
jgi:hypothetical protein